MVPVVFRLKEVFGNSKNLPLFKHHLVYFFILGKWNCCLNPKTPLNRMCLNWKTTRLDIVSSTYHFDICLPPPIDLLKFNFQFGIAFSPNQFLFRSWNHNSFPLVGSYFFTNLFWSKNWELSKMGHLKVNFKSLGVLITVPNTVGLWPFGIFGVMYLIDIGVL